MDVMHIAHTALRQIDDGEYRDPDDVERVPEQAKHSKRRMNVGAESLGEDLPIMVSSHSVPRRRAGRGSRPE